LKLLSLLNQLLVELLQLGVLPGQVLDFLLCVVQVFLFDTAEGVNRLAGNESSVNSLLTDILRLLLELLMNQELLID